MQTETSKKNGRGKEETAMVAKPSYAEAKTITKIADATEFKNAMAGFEMAPSFLTLEKGDCLTAILDGQGVVEIEDQVTREPKSVATWIFNTPEGKIEVLGAHELNRKLNPVKTGSLVRVVRGPDEKVNGRNVTRYEVGILPPGKF